MVSGHADKEVQMRRLLRHRWTGLLATLTTTSMLACGSQLPASETIDQEGIGCALVTVAQANATVEAQIYRLTPHQAQLLAGVWDDWGHGVYDIATLDAERLSRLQPIAAAAFLESVPVAQPRAGQEAVLRAEGSGGPLDEGSGARIAIAPEPANGDWVARVAYEESGQTTEGKRMVRRSETRVPLASPVAVLSVESRRLVVIGVGTSTRAFQQNASNHTIEIAMGDAP